MESIVKIILSFVNAFLSISLISKIIEKDFSYKSIKFIISMLVIGVLLYFSAMLPGYQFVLTLLFLILMVMFLFKEPIENTVAAVFIYMFLVMITDMIVVVIVSIFKYNHANQLINIILSLIIYLLSFILLKIRGVKKFKKFLLENAFKYRFQMLILLFGIAIFQMIHFTFTKQMNFIHITIFTLIVLFVFFLIILLTLEKIKTRKVSASYDDVLKNMKEYEHLFDESRKQTHEYRNHLMMIKTMSDNKKIASFINEILEESNSNIDSELLEQIHKIPISDIRGIIYYKLVDMKHEGISINVDVSPEIVKKKIKNLNEKDINDISRILAIYLDNAKDALKKIKKGKLSIAVFLKDDKRLVISIANNFSSSIDMDRVMKKGYSTKGYGHGYGLLLAKDLINNNKKLDNDTEWIKNIFIQNLIIRI